MKKLKILELFSGTECISNAFRKNGHECFTIDWDEQFPSNWHVDIGTITSQDIINRFCIPDIVWIAPNCKTYSLAAISKHRKKNLENGNLDPISNDAIESDNVNQHVLKILEELIELNPNMIFFIENPRACLQNMIWMKPYDKYKYLITYCKYMTDVPPNQRRMKPTNIWTNHSNPDFLPPCKNGSKDHASAPRGSKTGTQGMKGHKERSTYPELLCEHIVNICETHFGLRGDEINNE